MRTSRALLVLSAACILWGFGAHCDQPWAEGSLEEAVSVAGESKAAAPKELFLSKLLPLITDGQALKVKIIETRKSVLRLDQETLDAKAKLPSVKGVFEPIHSGLASKSAKPDQYGGGMSSRLEFIEKNLTKSLQELAKLPSSCDCAGAEAQWKAAAASQKLLVKTLTLAKQAKNQAAWTAKESDKLIKAALKDAKDETAAALNAYNKKLQGALEDAAKSLGKGLEGKSLNKKAMPTLGAQCGSIPALKIATQKEATEQLSGEGAPRKTLGNIAGPFTAVPSPPTAKAKAADIDIKGCYCDCTGQTFHPDCRTADYCVNLCGGGGGGGGDQNRCKCKCGQIVNLSCNDSKVYAACDQACDERYQARKFCEELWGKTHEKYEPCVCKKREGQYDYPTKICSGIESKIKDGCKKAENYNECIVADGCNVPTEILKTENGRKAYQQCLKGYLGDVSPSDAVSLCKRIEGDSRTKAVCACNMIGGQVVGGKCMGSCSGESYNMYGNSCCDGGKLLADHALVDEGRCVAGRRCGNEIYNPKKECCSGGKRYPGMVKKADGTCGCAKGKILNADGTCANPGLRERIANWAKSVFGGGGRPLTNDEIEKAKRIFGDNIDYSKVRIVTGDDMTLWGKVLTLGLKRPEAVSSGHAIYFPNDKEGKSTYDFGSEADVLVHEMTHIYQRDKYNPLSYQWGKAVDLINGLRGKDPYEYKLTENANFRDYSLEQQAAITQDFFIYSRKAKLSPEEMERKKNIETMLRKEGFLK